MDGVGRIIGEGGEPAGAEVARTRQRDSLFMIAQLRFAAKAAATEVRVRNLSAGGLMIEFDHPIAPGAMVTLEMRGIGEVTGTVAWCTRGRVGIALDAPIDPKRARKPMGGSTSGSVKSGLIVRAARR